MSLIDAKALRVRATLARLSAAGRHRDPARLNQGLRGLLRIIAGRLDCAEKRRRKNGDKGGDKKDDRVLALLDVGRTPVSLTSSPMAAS